MGQEEILLLPQWNQVGVMSVLSKVLSLSILCLLFHLFSLLFLPLCKPFLFFCISKHAFERVKCVETVRE